MEVERSEARGSRRKREEGKKKKKNEMNEKKERGKILVLLLSLYVFLLSGLFFWLHFSLSPRPVFRLDSIFAD